MALRSHNCRVGLDVRVPPRTTMTNVRGWRSTIEGSRAAAAQRRSLPCDSEGAIRPTESTSRAPPALGDDYYIYESSRNWSQMARKLWPAWPKLVCWTPMIGPKPGNTQGLTRTWSHARVNAFYFILLNLHACCPLPTTHHVLVATLYLILLSRHHTIIPRRPELKF